jgi:hypothetical protein
VSVPRGFIELRFPAVLGPDGAPQGTLQRPGPDDFIFIRGVTANRAQFPGPPLFETRDALLRFPRWTLYGGPVERKHEAVTLSVVEKALLGDFSRFDLPSFWFVQAPTATVAPPDLARTLRRPWPFSPSDFGKRGWQWIYEPAPPEVFQVRVPSTAELARGAAPSLTRVA